MYEQRNEGIDIYVFKFSITAPELVPISVVPNELLQLVALNQL